MNDNPYYSKKIQKILNKLISEEWFAGNMYRFYRLAVKPEEREIIEELFGSVGEDELDEHYGELVEWAERYGYEIPCSIRDMEKFAGDVSVRLFNSFKKGEDAEYYVNKAVEAEQDAIESYVNVLQEEELAQYGDLHGLILRNYNDEIEHLEKLGILGYVDRISVIHVQ